MRCGRPLVTYVHLPEFRSVPLGRHTTTPSADRALTALCSALGHAEGARQVYNQNGRKSPPHWAVQVVSPLPVPKGRNGLAKGQGAAVARPFTTRASAGASDTR